MYIFSCILLICWSILGSFDSTYYHDKKYSLHIHSESIKEHLYHTIRSICYPIIVFSLETKLLSSGNLITIVPPDNPFPT